MMTVREAIDVMEKDKACAERAMECINEKKACSSCEIYPYNLDEAQETAFRILQAWEKAKDDIRKACGCTTALDIMERYEKEEQIEPEKVRCVTCKHMRDEQVQRRNVPEYFCAAPIWKELNKAPHIIEHDPSEPILCDHWEAKKEGEA